MESVAFQDESYSRGKCCWVCGNDNPRGLYIKSYWDGEECARGEVLAVRVPDRKGPASNTPRAKRDI